MWFFLACQANNTIVFSGEQVSRGDSTVFLQFCNDKTPETKMIFEALELAWEPKNCQQAWEVLSIKTSVDISRVPISDVHIFSGLYNLTTFMAYDNQISDISTLKNLTRLEELYVMSNQISDISTLYHFSQLRVARLDGNLISDISVLAKLPRLEIIGLDQNKIQDFTPLQVFEELKSLNTNFNPVDLSTCPPSGKGPKQLHKYCKRMRKNAGLDEGIEFQDPFDKTETQRE